MSEYIDDIPILGECISTKRMLLKCRHDKLRVREYINIDVCRN